MANLFPFLYFELIYVFMLLLLLSQFSRVPLCATPLCDLIDGSPPGSPVPGILQARTLEWVAISFSKAWEWKVKVKWPHERQPTRLLRPWDFPGKSTGVGCHCLLCYVFIYKAILLLAFFCRYHTLKLCFFSQTEKSGFQLMYLDQHCPLKLSVMIEMLST